MTSAAFFTLDTIGHTISTFRVSEPNHSSFMSLCSTNALFPTPTTELHFIKIKWQERKTQQSLSLLLL